MIKRIVTALKKLWEWVRHWFWEVPVAKPPKEKIPRLKGEEVFKEFMVITYHGQRINMHIREYPIWKAMGRKDKRAMASKFARQEKEGLIRFEMIEGKLICLKNKNYG